MNALRNMAGALALSASMAIAGTGYAAQSDVPANDESVDQVSIALTHATTDTTAAAERTGESQDHVWWGGFGLRPWWSGFGFTPWWGGFGFTPWWGGFGFTPWWGGFGFTPWWGGCC